MNRRNLLKQAGMAALASPFLGAGFPTRAAVAAMRPLVIVFSGPFVFWREAENIRVMAPPVGPSDPIAPHQPWLGTSGNETQIVIPSSSSSAAGFSAFDGAALPSANDAPALPPPVSNSAPPLSLSLTMSSVSGQQSQTGVPSTAEILSFKQGQAANALPALFYLHVPIPDAVVGIHPVEVCVSCGGSCTNSADVANRISTLASGAVFLYNHVDPSSLMVACPGPANGIFPYYPSFQYDAALPCATLQVNMTPVNPIDPMHVHAARVVARMLAMFPWVKATIGFCGGIGADIPDVGLGDDCAVPVLQFNS